LGENQLSLETIVYPDLSGVVAVPSVGPVKEMLTVKWDGKQTLVRVNSSSLGLIQTCARKSFYKLDQGWKSKNGSPPLAYGTALHKALQVFYEHPARERTIPNEFAKHAGLMGQGYAAPETHFLYDAIAAFVKSAAPLAGLPDDDKRSIQSGIWVLTNYFNVYLHDQYVIHVDAHGPVVEREFSIPFWEDTQLRIELFGTIDFAFKNTATGDVLVGDHKTVSQMGTEFMNRVKPNHQYTGYLFAAHRLLGVSCENFIVNGVEVKAKPKTARGGPPKFIRQITHRSPEDFAEFHWVVRDAVDSYLRWKERDRWPLGDVNACAMYGGCEFLDVCSAPAELRDNILDAKFQRSKHANT
jgi:hypothetical protein